MRILDDKDIAAVSAAFSQVVKDAIGQTASVLVPALEHAGRNIAGGVSVTIGPIVIEPIKIKLEVGE